MGREREEGKRINPNQRVNRWLRNNYWTSKGRKIKKKKKKKRWSAITGRWEARRKIIKTQKLFWGYWTKKKTNSGKWTRIRSSRNFFFFLPGYVSANYYFQAIWNLLKQKFCSFCGHLRKSSKASNSPCHSQGGERIFRNGTIKQKSPTYSLWKHTIGASEIGDLNKTNKTTRRGFVAFHYRQPDPWPA